MRSWTRPRNPNKDQNKRNGLRPQPKAEAKAVKIMNLLQYYSAADPKNVDDEIAFRLYMDRRNAERKAQKQQEAIARPKKKRKRSKPTRRAKSTPATRWLRQHICSLVYGDLTPMGFVPA